MEHSARTEAIPHGEAMRDRRILHEWLKPIPHKWRSENQYPTSGEATSGVLVFRHEWGIGFSHKWSIR